MSRSLRTHSVCVERVANCWRAVLLWCYGASPTVSIPNGLAGGRYGAIIALLSPCLSHREGGTVIANRRPDLRRALVPIVSGPSAFDNIASFAQICVR